MALIEFRGVKKAFGPKIVYEDLSLDVYRGESLTITGGSGQSKGAMLGLLIGLPTAENLRQATEALAAPELGKDLEETADNAGAGTIGGLSRDPSIYEGVKRLGGDLQRNEILWALVRYSVRRDEPVEPVHAQVGDHYFGFELAQGSHGFTTAGDCAYLVAMRFQADAQ